MILGAFLLGGVAGYVLHAALHLPYRTVQVPRTGVVEPPSGVTILGPLRRPYDQEAEREDDHGDDFPWAEWSTALAEKIARGEHR
jgi:hypothetical protein